MQAIILAASAMLCGAPFAGPEYPGPSPGKARFAAAGREYTLQNDVIGVTWHIGGGRFALQRLADVGAKQEFAPAAEAFALALAEGKTLRAGELRLRGEPRCEPVRAAADAQKLAGDGGQSLMVTADSPDGALEVTWKAMLRDGSNYVRQEVALRAKGEAVPVESTVLFDLPLAGAKTYGTVDGSPVVAGRWFFGCEHPMADNRGDGQRVVCRVGTFGPIATDRPRSRAAVVGITPAGQLRRAFLYYLERERARRYQPFLHYNSWYDIAWGDRKMNEPQCLAVIEQFGRELVEQRQATLDAVVFDDGWDDNRTLWRFHPGFPRGFTPLAKAAAERRTAVGVWLSPWGGYGQAKNERMQYGKQEGFETNANGFSLAGPKYYGRFRDVCAEMVEKYGVNYFKFDGIGASVSAAGAAQYAADVDGLLRLTADLRQLRPDLFVNITTGTWPSPFWLGWCDSIWRSGNDMGFHGAGSPRQRWITYRDMIVYRQVVGRGPLFPLSSLMTQGIAHAVLGPPAQLSDDLKEMADEMRSFFASGTQLQELYISPQRMTGPMWDLLAEGARWSRGNADVLCDVHWLGGDPGKAEVYGFAAWSPRQGMLALRNPAAQAGAIEVEVGKAFELPHGAPRAYRLQSPWKSPAAAEITLRAGQPRRFDLAGFEVMVFDAAPLPANASPAPSVP
jgi:hypothetical protein